MLLQSFNRKSFAFAFALVATLAGVSMQAGPARAAGPFSAFAGAWSGGGTIAMSDGTRERIRCRVTYSVRDAGNALVQNLVCASDSYKFDVRSDVQTNAGSLSGSWTETTRGVTGQVSGHVSGGIIRATVMGGAFSAALSLAVRGNSQSVVIQPQSGADVRQVMVRLRRS
ncbi:MAG: hypothetical protein ACYC5H_12075 [Methylovirgula sp.]